MSFVFVFVIFITFVFVFQIKVHVETKYRRWVRQQVTTHEYMTLGGKPINDITQRRATMEDDYTVNDNARRQGTREGEIMSEIGRERAREWMTTHEDTTCELLR